MPRTSRLKGIVKFEDGAAAEFANVVLQTKDSVFVTGTTADLKGSFSLEKIAKGNYLLVLSSIGYENNIIDLEGLSASVDLGEKPAPRYNRLGKCNCYGFKYVEQG